MKFRAAAGFVSVEEAQLPGQIPLSSGFGPQRRAGEKQQVLRDSFKDANPIHESSMPLTSSNPNNPSKTSLPNPKHHTRES